MTGESDDAFLNGRVRAYQPRRGYRAGIDAVLLAAAVPVRAGERVLELGCGAGVVLACLARRVPGAVLTGVERRQDYAALALRNCARNGVEAEIVKADIAALTPGLKAQSFDHVIANPPFLDRRHGKPGANAARESAISAEAPLRDWAAVGRRRLRPGGRLTMIAPMTSLPDLLSVLGGRGVTVCPIASRAGRAPERMLIVALKGRRTVFRLTAPFVVHEGAARSGDDDDFAPEMQAILREGQAFETI